MFKEKRVVKAKKIFFSKKEFIVSSCFPVPRVQFWYGYDFNWFITWYSWMLEHSSHIATVWCLSEEAIRCELSHKYLLQHICNAKIGTPFLLFYNLQVFSFKLLHTKEILGALLLKYYSVLNLRFKWTYCTTDKLAHTRQATVRITWFMETQ